ncbi:MAG: dephospho-CoA kinase, partial [Alphaproteobacteria bacterium]|nr:dephospho-CoA kinase [Alphaproteobacteria bacterium]
MIVIGLTGSIGMGKSTVAGMFRRYGVPVFDADAEVHRLQGPHSAILPLIEARFPDVVGIHGVDRAKLGAAVLGNPEALRALEAIIHPAVAHARRRFLHRNRAHKLVVLDIPLLLESGRAENVDKIVVVSAPYWRQRKHVLRRTGMTVTKFRAILAHQMPDRKKRAQADFVIDTGCMIINTRNAVRKLVTCIRAARGQYGLNA